MSIAYTNTAEITAYKLFNLKSNPHNYFSQCFEFYFNNRKKKEIKSQIALKKYFCHTKQRLVISNYTYKFC